MGEVVTSHADDFDPGDVVAHDLGWREYGVIDPTRATKVDPQLAPPNAYLYTLGMPGLTAYAGLVEKSPNSAPVTSFSSPRPPERSAHSPARSPNCAVPLT